MNLATIIGMLAEGLPQAILSGLVYGSIYALIAQGYYITFSTTDTLNFAQGDFLMIAAMLSFSVMGGLALSGAPLWLGFLAAVVTVAVILGVMGIVVERVAIRPLRGLLSFGWVLSTVGVGVILRQAAEIIWGREHMRVPSIFGDKAIRIDIGGVQAGILPQEIFILVASLGVMIATLLFLKRSRLGKAMAAVALNPSAAALMGINVRSIVILSYVLSSVFAGLAGILVAPVLFAHAHMGALPGLKAFAVGIIGGLGNPVGILIVGLALGMLEFIVAIFNASLRDAVTFLILIVILAWRPMGLFEISRREKV